jgi:hypothetical protein
MSAASGQELIERPCVYTIAFAVEASAGNREEPAPDEENGGDVGSALTRIVLMGFVDALTRPWAKERSRMAPRAPQARRRCCHAAAGLGSRAAGTRDGGHGCAARVQSPGFRGVRSGPSVRPTGASEPFVPGAVPWSLPMADIQDFLDSRASNSNSGLA